MMSKKVNTLRMVKVIMGSGRRKSMSCGRRFLRAFTLIEVVVSILIIMVLVNGVLGYQYFSTRDVRLSEVQASASRLALLLLESWKGSSGAAGYDPVSQFGSELSIESIAQGPAVPEEDAGFTKHGSYGVQMEGTYFYVTLSNADAAETLPAILNAAVAWRKDYAAGELAGDESTVRFSCFVIEP
jgi:type II secretory pathway pseudopilin PulG